MPDAYRMAHRLRAACALAALLLATAVHAQSQPRELPGAQDHPAVSRYKGAVLQNASNERFASLLIPLGPGKFQNGGPVFEPSVKVEGSISARYYVMPPAAQPLEVFRNYQSALVQAGFKPLFTCEPAVCDKALINEQYRSVLLYPRKWAASRIDPGSGSSPRELHYWSGKGTRDGSEVYVIVWVASADSTWNAATASIVVVEPKVMEGDKVSATLEQMQRGLQAEGRVALYGLYFDTGKSEVKPDSKPQLEEMARLLKAEPGLRVFVIGHTDNQGALDANLQLSQRRAEAVVAALSTQHGIDAKRLSARGVANFAPLASNAAEAGRAKNRRVELVAQ
jgi:OmpA-OmpF porin, OOP family